MTLLELNIVSKRHACTAYTVGNWGTEAREAVTKTSIACTSFAANDAKCC